MTEERVIWGKWNCSSCGVKGISAKPPEGEKSPRCPQCGSAREVGQNEEAYLDNARDETGKVLDAVVAETPEEVAIAKGGADWECSSCKATNRAREAACTSCGGTRSKDARELEAEPTPKKNSGATPQPQPKATPKKSSAAPIIFFLFALIVSILGYQWWGKRVNTITAKVASMKWQHVVSREAFSPTTLREWRTQLTEAAAKMPSDGRGEIAGIQNIRNCKDEHLKDERYACGVDTRCSNENVQVPDGQDCHKECKTKSNRNGSFTESCGQVCTPKYRSESRRKCEDVTKFCTRPIYAAKCDYDTYVWKPVETKKTEGSDSNNHSRLPWPDLKSGSLERITKTESYAVSIEYPFKKAIKTHLLVPKSEAEFLPYSVGQPVPIKMNNFGELTGF